jgi:AcrR family transcriptional regulator
MEDDRKIPYHHGDLRAALLVAAEAELADAGIEAFSLRRVARRAGVSHAAPAHHFGDVQGLLTALAAEGFRRLVAAQAAREAGAAPDARSQLVATGLGYVDFALANPPLFRLIFGSSRPDHDEPALAAAGGAAYRQLTARVAAAGGQDIADVAAAWAMAHGLADLIIAGRLKGLEALDEAARARAVKAIVERALPRPETPPRT